MAYLIFAVVGWGIGVFAFSNVLLPLFWAYPRARRLGLNLSFSRFIFAPMLWSVLLFISLVIVSIMSDDSFGGYLLGLGAGFLQIGKLVVSPNQDMEEDFVRTYGG